MVDTSALWFRQKSGALAAAALAAVTLAGGCRRAPPPPPPDRPAAAAPAAPNDDPPVPLNANTPLVYPTALLRAGIEGTALVRMYTDERGKPVPDSTRIAESSGYPTLDSAALAAAPRLRFAPARHDGKPVATPFLQPFQFRNPARTEVTP